MNLIEIGIVVIEIRGAENGELAVPVNNTLVHHMAFLAADTRPCVLICSRFTSSLQILILRFCHSSQNHKIKFHVKFLYHTVYQ